MTAQTHRFAWTVACVLWLVVSAQGGNTFRGPMEWSGPDEPTLEWSGPDEPTLEWSGPDEPTFHSQWMPVADVQEEHREDYIAGLEARAKKMSGVLQVCHSIDCQCSEDSKAQCDPKCLALGCENAEEGGCVYPERLKMSLAGIMVTLEAKTPTEDPRDVMEPVSVKLKSLLAGKVDLDEKTKNLPVCPTASSNNILSFSRFDRNVAARMARHTAAVYCPEEALPKWKCKFCVDMSNKGHVEIISVFQDRASHIQGYVAVDHFLKAVVVPFRGTTVDTELLKNWMSNLDIIKAPFTGIGVGDGLKVHRGFLEAYNAVRKSFMEAYGKAHKKYPTYGLLLSGHSMGGALATLAALDLELSLTRTFEDPTVYSYGMPRVGDYKFVETNTRVVPNAFRVVRGTDPVAHSPPKRLGYRHGPQEIWITPKDDDHQSRIRECSRTDGEDNSCADERVPRNPFDHAVYFGALMGGFTGCGDVSVKFGMANPPSTVFGEGDGISTATVELFDAYFSREAGVESEPRRDGASKWMLTEGEITEARHSVPRNDIAISSNGNEAVPLLDGESFMRMLYVDIEKAQRGDFVHGTLFDENGNLIMDPKPGNDEHNDYTTVHSTLIRAIKRGVHVRILANLSSYLPANAANFCRALNAVCESRNCCVPDRRHNGHSGSMHSKLWVVQREGDTVAFMGGIDLAAGRFDTSAHDKEPKWKVEPPLVGPPYYGWHDNMYYLKGPVVIDCARHFWQRWNDPSSPVPLAPSSFNYAPTPFEWVEPDQQPSASGGGLSIQFLRTLSCQAGVYYGFQLPYAPLGEFTFREAFKKMIRNAREYVYLEDQFAFYPEIFAFIREEMHHIKKIIVVTDNYSSWKMPLPMGRYLPYMSNARQYYQNKALSELKKSDKRGNSYGDRVHVYELTKPNGDDTIPDDLVYDHSKNYIVDDEYMITGSAGLELAGFMSDEDTAIGIYDSKGKKGPDSYVGLVRRVLMAHHLGLRQDDESLSNPLDAIAKYDAQIEANPTGRVRKYWPEPIEHQWYMDRIYGLFENSGECSDEEINVALARLPNVNAEMENSETTESPSDSPSPSDLGGSISSISSTSSSRTTSPLSDRSSSFEDDEEYNRQQMDVLVDEITEEFGEDGVDEKTILDMYF